MNKQPPISFFVEKLGFIPSIWAGRTLKGFTNLRSVLDDPLPLGTLSLALARAVRPAPKVYAGETKIIPFPTTAKLEVI